MHCRCTPIYDLGSGPHNTVRWSPHGRFVAVAGFGNLPGDLVFYEKKADGKCKKVGATRCALSARINVKVQLVNRLGGRNVQRGGRNWAFFGVTAHRVSHPL
jgi:hypothetical protein